MVVLSLSPICAFLSLAGMNLDPDRVPENLSMAIAMFNAALSEEDKVAFMTVEESSLPRFHHTIGAYLRNEWSLWDSQTPLCLYFKQFKITYPDDISSVIMIAAWRVLNNEPLAAEDLLRPCQNP